MIPQIENSLTNIDLLNQVKIPNKTYKLIFDEDSQLTNYHKFLITFSFENGNLYVNYPDDIEGLDTFELDLADLIVSSETADILDKYEIDNNYLFQNTDSKYLTNSTVDRIVGYTTDINAIKQAIYHILMTERYAYDIYDNNYGVELNQYIGQGIDFLRASIEDTLKDALLQDERISSVRVTDIQKLTKDTVNIQFSVTTVINEITMEVNVNV